MHQLIKELANDPMIYEQWFQQANDDEERLLWTHIWDQAARTHSDNEFVQGVYDFYQQRGFLTHRQFYFLVTAVMKTTHSLKDRLQ